MDRPMPLSDLLLDVANIASSTQACDRKTAGDIVDLLTHRRPYDAVSLSLYDPLLQTHQTIASQGYEDGVLSHLNGWLVTDDAIYQRYKREGTRQRALKWSQMPFRYQESFSAREVFIPAGFREGVTLRLHSLDGRYTGNLHISTSDDRYPTQDMMDQEVQRLQTLLGNFVDSLRVASEHYSAGFDQASGFVLKQDGECLKLPGIALLKPEIRRALAEQLGALNQSQIPETFYFRSNMSWYKVITGIIGDRSRVIIADESSIPLGLTPREFEIVDSLVVGSTNTEIAKRMFVTRATVLKHLENIYEKLDCPNRTALVGMAMAANLRLIPAS